MLFTLKDLEHYDNLEFLAKQVVEGYIVGMHKSPLHGFSVEFAEHRLYNLGEDVKNIDWKVFARNEKLFVKTFEEETNLRCQLVIDISSSMFFEQGKKLKFSVFATAILIHLLKKQRDAVGLSLFSENIDEHIKPRSSVSHHKYVYSILENLLNKVNKNLVTNASAALHHISETISKRSLVVIFSDMMENMNDRTELFSALQHLKHNKHEVLLFHIFDKNKEIDLNLENRPYKFINIESGEEVKLNPIEIKKEYHKKMIEFIDELKIKCGMYKIDFVEVDVNQDFSHILLPYLLKRNRMP